MTGPNLRKTRLAGILVAIGCLVALPAVTSAQRGPRKVEKIGDGTLITVLPPDAIPAISDPEFVSAEEAGEFMKDEEPVLGLFDGKVAKAYSLWHLDRHEIVNDSLPGLGPVAVTW